ncbi:MAG: hypothetical protein WAO83_17775 [Fuerstiella sp.]
MSIQIQCFECDYEGVVSDKEAGKTVTCPECDEAIAVPAKGTGGRKAPGSARRNHRVQKGSGNTAGIFLAGAAVLLVGVLGMLAVRMYSIPQEDLTAASNAVIYGEGENAGANNGAAESLPALGQPTKDEGVIDLSKIDVIQQPGSEDEDVTSPVMDSGIDDSSAPASVVSISPQDYLMARMTQLGVNVIPFPEDLRGYVTKAITSSTNAAMESCKLKCVEIPNQPIMQVKLKMVENSGVKGLSVAAELQADMQGIPVKLWERSETLIALDDKALENGILPPDLGRKLNTFFTTLRTDLVSARRAVIAMEKARKQ